MCGIPKPEISPDFTVDDIHRIREWHYECTKDLTPQEVTEEINREGLRLQAEIEALRARELARSYETDNRPQPYGPTKPW